MIIKKLKIRNFRNFQDVTIPFHEKLNFIIGENNIGKSNFLDLLEILFSPNRFFSESDFKDVNKPIVCELIIRLDNAEKNLFYGYEFIDSLVNNTLTLRFVQD